MKQQKLSTGIWLFAAVSVLVVSPVRADVIKQSAVQLKEATNRKEPITDIPQLSDIQHPYTSVKDWVAQATQQNQVIQVTGVRLSPTANGLEVILETPTSNKLQTTTKSDGNTFTAIISNAQLRSKSGSSFRFNNPTAGITTVTVTNQDANSILVKVMGEAGLPTLKLFDSNSGLIFAFTSAVSSTQQQQQPQKPGTNKPSSGTPPTKPSASGSEPIELVVRGEAEGSYNPPTASTATKIEVPLSNIPQSIQVIPRQVIEDRQVVRLSELTDNVSGVQHTPGYGGISSISSLFIRGFEQGPENFRNGFRDYGYLSPRDVSNVERVEFLKGPGSVLYGGGVYGVGGVVNTVTKKPLTESRYEANLTVGSYDFYRPAIDLTGPLTSNRSLLYRLNLAYENAGGFRDFNQNESVFVTPALTWQIDPRTKLTTEIEYANDRRVPDFGFPSEPESLRLPRNRFLGVPGFSDENTDSISVTYNFEHEFSDNWRFRQGFNALNVKQDIQGIFYNSLQSDRRTLDRYASKSNEEQENYTLQNEIFGKFNTGSLRHNILLGVELARFTDSYTFLQASVGPIDIFNPVYNAKVGEFAPSDAGKNASDNLGIYLQDFIEVLPNLKLLAGGRLDLNDLFSEATTREEQSNSHFSPRVGVVYQPSETTSLYFSWSNSFNPPFSGRSRTGEQFQPETGEQYEVGVKQEFLNNQLSATLALYQLTRQNVLTVDPVDSRYSIQTGEQRSRGIELDIAGQILPGWKIIATYAYTDALVTKDNRIPVGDVLRGVPLNSASLWTTYEIQKGNLQGLGFGAGLYYAGEREQQLPNNIKLPSYVRTDAAIFYRRNNYKFALNIKNLFSVKYFEVGSDGPYPRAPLTVLGTVSVEF